MNITEFLTARYDEDEAAVHKWWTALDRDEKGVPAWIINAGGLVHPVRVLADIAAKRAIVALHPVYEYHQTANPWREKKTFLHCDTCGDPQGWDQTPPVDWPCPTLIALAQPYAEHADFDPEWRVG